MKGKNILVVAPHADDEAFGCGGMLGSLKEDNNIMIALGITTRHDNINNLCTKHGFSIDYFNGVDQQLEMQSHSSCIDWLREVINTHKIDTVFMPYIHDVNEDHKFMAECANVACRPQDSGIKNLLMYEIPETTQLAFIPFVPNYYIEFTNMHTKTQFLKYYVDELRDKPSPRNGASIKIHAEYRATQCGSLHYAEAFQIVRMTNNS